MRALLVDVLFAVGVRQKRIALWVDWRDLSAADIDHNTGNSDGNPIEDWESATKGTAPDNDAVLLLLALVEELCLGQIPTLVLDQGHPASGVALRDAILMGCIQDKRKMETATEAELLRDFCSRIQQNLRICVFDTGSAVSRATCPRAPAAMRGHHKGAGARLNTLRAWMCTRASCVWLQLDIRSHQVDRITTAMAEQMAALATSVPSDVETTSAALTVPLPRYGAVISPGCLTTLHRHVMSFANSPDHNSRAVKVAPEHSVEYFLSFMVNLSAQWRRVIERETNINAWYRQAIERFEVLTTELLPQVAARQVLLDKSIREMSKEAERADIVTADDGEAVYPVLQTESEPVGGAPDEALSVAEALAQREYDSWCRRSQREERGLMRCELEVERQTLALFMAQWQQALPRAKALMERWQEAVKARQTARFWNKRLGETILRVVGVSYPFVWSVEGDYKVAHLELSCMGGVKQILKENELYQPGTSSPELHEDTPLPIESIDDGERSESGGNPMDSVDSDAATLFLANLLMTA